MKFRPEDFCPYTTHDRYCGDFCLADDMCKVANAKLKEWLDGAPVVYSQYGSFEEWWDSKDSFDRTTHTAKLVCIEEIVADAPKKEKK